MGHTGKDKMFADLAKEVSALRRENATLRRKLDSRVAFCGKHPDVKLTCTGCAAAKGAKSRTAKQRAASARNGRAGGRPPLENAVTP
jgi:hypothetical protein